MSYGKFSALLVVRGGGRFQVPFHTLFQAQMGTRVELPTFCKLHVAGLIEFKVPALPKPYQNFYETCFGVCDSLHL
jgi:hypothetical protein